MAFDYSFRAQTDETIGVFGLLVDFQNNSLKNYYVLSKNIDIQFLN